MKRTWYLLEKQTRGQLCDPGFICTRCRRIWRLLQKWS